MRPGFRSVAKYVPLAISSPMRVPSDDCLKSSSTSSSSCLRFPTTGNWCHPRSVSVSHSPRITWLNPHPGVFAFWIGKPLNIEIFAVCIAPRWYCVSHAALGLYAHAPCSSMNSHAAIWKMAFGTICTVTWKVQTEAGKRGEFYVVSKGATPKSAKTLISGQSSY